MICVHSKMSETAWQMTVWMTINVADDSLFFYLFFLHFPEKTKLDISEAKTSSLLLLWKKKKKKKKLN